MGEALRFREIPYCRKPNNSPLIIDGYDNEDLVKDPIALKTVTDIMSHKERVCNRLMFLSKEIERRAVNHDNSKLKDPELGWLIEMDREPKYEYGSTEYFAKMERWNKFFKHHYLHNRHHPDHFTMGIDGMTIVDLAEYMVDIISYYDEMHPEQAIKTIEKQKERFKLSDQLCNILKNTLLEYYSWMGGIEPISITEAKMED